MNDFCSTSLPAFGVVNATNFSHSNRWGLIYIFLMTIDVEYHFMCLSDNYIIFNELSVKVFSPFLSQIVLFCHWIEWVLNIFWKLTHYQIYHLQCLLQFKRQLFHFVDRFLHCKRAFSLWLDPTCLFLLLLLLTEEIDPIIA